MLLFYFYFSEQWCYRLACKVYLPQRIESTVLSMLQTSTSSFEEALFLPVTVFLVKKGCLHMEFEVQDLWDVEIIQYSMESGTFAKRVIVWLRAAGLDLTSDEERSVQVKNIELNEITEDSGQCGKMRTFIHFSPHMFVHII